MTDPSEEATIEKLYQYGEQLNSAKDKSQNVKDYQGIIAVAKTSVKAKQLSAQLIPKFFKFFPEQAGAALETHLDLVEADELGVRVQAIRGLPLFCKDTPENIGKMVDILVQLLGTEEFVERDAVHKALMSLLRQDVKASLTSLFKHIRGVEEPSTEPSTDDVIREKVINFVRDKVFPIKAELLKPQEEMERHITDLIKTSLDDVTGVEFRMFMDFLKSLSLFGEKCPHERIKELIGVVEEQAELELEFKVADADHNDRLISCLHMALPIVVRGASSSNFMNFINKKIIPVFDQLPGERKVDLLRSLAEFSPFTTPQDSRQMLPSIVQLLKKYMTWKKTGEEMNFTYVECLLYTFHHLAHKVPNATNSLCGYKIVTGQPSDRLGEDFSEQYNDFTERLKNVEEFTRATIKKLTQGMSENNKSLADAKTDEEKEKIKTKKQNATTGLRTCNNILTMTKPLHAKAPSFIGDKKTHTIPKSSYTMSSFTHATTLLHAHIKTKHKNTSNTSKNNINDNLLSSSSSSSSSSKTNETTRRNLMSTFVATSIIGINVATTPLALAQNWGTRSFLKEHFFEPGLSPEDAVLRIKQTAEGLHNLREMLEHLSWRYVMFYIRLKQNYLEQDLKNAITTLPENRRKEYVKTANQLVDNLTEMDRYVRSPKVYESYLYYEKTLKSIDELVALLA